MAIYKYSFTNRGLCSELNSLLFLYNNKQISNSNHKISIDYQASPFFQNFSFFDVFQKNDIFINNTDNLECITLKRFNTGLLLRPIDSVLLYKSEFYIQIKSIISELHLPASFACLHIRRGDKVGEAPYAWTQKTGRTESKRFEFSDYLKHCEDIETIFIMTDDYCCIQEAREHISKNNLPNKIIHLTIESQTGHSTERYLTKELSFQKNQLIQFFAEIEIVKLSDVFVGTRTSNVYRYIMNTCTTNTKFISLD